MTVSWEGAALGRRIKRFQNITTCSIRFPRKYPETCIAGLGELFNFGDVKIDFSMQNGDAVCDVSGHNTEKATLVALTNLNKLVCVGEEGAQSIVKFVYGIGNWWVFFGRGDDKEYPYQFHLAGIQNMPGFFRRNGIFRCLGHGGKISHLVSMSSDSHILLPGPILEAFIPLICESYKYV